MPQHYLHEKQQARDFPGSNTPGTTSA